jgi:hypothetical protein
MRLWLVEHRDSQLKFYPPEWFRRPRRKQA